jgi:hypothetical protein
MKPLLWLLVIPLLFLFNHLNKRKQRELRVIEAEKAISDERESLLNKLRDSKRFEVEGYAGETKTVMSTLMEKAELVTDAWFEPGKSFDDNKVATLAFLDELSAFRDSLKNGIATFETIQRDYDSFQEELRTFFDSTTFYPPDFTFLANSLEAKSTEMKEVRRTDPLISTKVYTDFLDMFKKQIESFRSIHQDITLLLEKFDTVKDTLSENDAFAFSELKQKIFFSLHQGEFANTKQLIERFENKIKGFA